MRTMFQMGFGQDIFWMGNPGLGQEPAVTVSRAERDGTLKDLDGANGKVQALQAWQKNHPDPQRDLGTDFQRYQELLHNLDALSGDAANVYAKFSPNEPALWGTVRADEWNRAGTWVMFADEIYGILVRHPTAAAPRPGAAAPGAKPGVPAPSAGLSPLAIGVGAAAVVGLLAVALS